MTSGVRTFAPESVAPEPAVPVARWPAGATVTVTIDGRMTTVACGTLVSAAAALAEPARPPRLSPAGMRRQAFCGMGICGECRVTIDGRRHRLGCQTLCAPGMEICSDD